MKPIIARILHNPRCSKSRAALALLTERNIAVEVIPYLTAPPSVVDLRELLTALARPVQDMIRFGEARAAELGLSPEDVRSDEAWLTLLAANPILIERPVVVIGTRAVIGRPPESVLTLLASDSAYST